MSVLPIVWNILVCKITVAKHSGQHTIISNSYLDVILMVRSFSHYILEIFVSITIFVVSDTMTGISDQSPQSDVVIDEIKILCYFGAFRYKATATIANTKLGSQSAVKGAKMSV
jgi:hypothetical protein